MKTIYMHIGPPKSGTTTIQQSLNDNKGLLLANGYYIPKTGQVSDGQSGHHNLAWELNLNSRFDSKNGTWEELKKELENIRQQNIILSAEGFSFISEDGLAKIKNLFHDYTIKVIVYLRRQDLRLQSMWSERLKRSTDNEIYENFPDWLAHNQEEFLKLDYQELLHKWSQIFNKENIIVRIFEKSQFHGTLFQDFLAACNVPHPNKYTETRDMNLSPGIKNLVLIQEFKKRFMGKLDTASGIRFYSAISEYAESAGWNDPKWSLIDKFIFDRIMQMFEFSNRVVARDYFDREELFFESFDDSRLVKFTSQDFKPDELLDLFSHITLNLFSQKQGDELVQENVLLKKEIESIYKSKKWMFLRKINEARKKIRFIFQRPK